MTCLKVQTAVRKTKGIGAMPLSELGLGILAERRLEQEGIRTIGGLVGVLTERLLQPPKPRNPRNRREPNRGPDQGLRMMNDRPDVVRSPLPGQPLGAFLGETVRSSNSKPPTLDLLLKLVQSELRRPVLLHVLNGEHDVRSIAERCELDKSHVSRSLAAFHRCGFLLRRREGKRIFYSLNRAVRVQIADGMAHIELPAANGEKVTLDLQHIDSTMPVRDSTSNGQKDISRDVERRNGQRRVHQQFDG